MQAAEPTIDDPGYVNFLRLMALDECVCAEIDPSDRPCLTCGAQAELAEAGLTPAEEA